MAEKHRNVAVFPEFVPILEIPDKVCTYAGMTMTWSGEYSFGVFAHDHNASQQDRPSQYAPCVAKVHNIRTDSILFDPIARNLVNESNGCFLFAQKLAEKNSPDFPMEVLKLSRQYRSVIRACLESFQNEAESGPEDKKRFYLQNIPTLYNMELIWHLCEILFIDVMPGDVVLSQLVTWIRFHVPQVEKEANKILSEAPLDVDYVPNYWLVIIDCLLQRRIDTVRALLKLHSQFQTESFQLADRVLRTMPIFELYGGLTATEFHVRHGCWRAEAERLLADGHFSIHKYLAIIVKIVIGDDSVQDIIRPHCETWYQHMVAHLLYTEPTVKVFDLSYHASQSMTRHGGPEAMRQLDWVLCAIMEIDLFKMVERLQEWTERDWLPTHLTHLLSLCGKLDVTTSQGSNFGRKLCDHLLLGYGSLMLSHRSLWQVGVDYLDAVADRGEAKDEARSRLEALLARVPCRSDAKAVKLQAIARERGMGELVYSVGKAQGLRHLARGNPGAALTWAIRSQDPVFATHLADVFLKGFMATGSFEAESLLRDLGPGMMLSDRLAFLGKYCEFRQMCEVGELKEAGTLLVHMLVNKVAPKYFWLTLLGDSLPLLEPGKGVMSSKDSFDLMSCVQELVQEESPVDTTAVRKVRQALAISLAEALVLEGSRGG